MRGRAERVYMMFCHRHRLQYRFGSRCPKCAEDQIRAQQYAASGALNQRWGTLCSQPALLNQDQFGICGTTSAVYLLLRHDQNRARELYEATFADLIPAHRNRTFQIALGHQPVAINFRNLARRYQLGLERAIAKAPAELEAELKKRGWDDAKIRDTKQKKPIEYQEWVKLLHVNTECFVDFCVARGLGYVFKQIAKARYDGEKTEFNLEFSDPQALRDYRTFTRYGNFALRTYNLAFILQDILGAKDVHIASKDGPPPAAVPLAPPVPGVTSSTFSTVKQLEGEFTRRFGMGHAAGKFAVVSVFGDLCQPRVGHVSRASPAGAEQGTKQRNQMTYNHWVVFNGFSSVGAAGICRKNHVNLKVWTWKTNFDVNVCEEHLLSYIQDVIFGHF